MRHLLLVTVLVGTAALAGCTGDLSASNFTLTANAVGWKTGDIANFTLVFDPSGADETQYEIDTTFAMSQLRFEKEGLNLGGDYETNKAGDLGVKFERGNNSYDSFLFTSDRNEVYLRLKVPDQLKDGEYVLEMELFKIGIVKSDVFRIARP